MLRKNKDLDLNPTNLDDTQSGLPVTSDVITPNSKQKRVTSPKITAPKVSAELNTAQNPQTSVRKLRSALKPGLLGRVKAIDRLKAKETAPSPSLDVKDIAPTEVSKPVAPSKQKSNLAFPLKIGRDGKAKTATPVANPVTSVIAQAPIAGVADDAAQLNMPVPTFRDRRRGSVSKPKENTVPAPGSGAGQAPAELKTPVSAKGRGGLLNRRTPPPLQSIISPLPSKVPDPDRVLTGDPVLDDLPIPIWRAVTEKSKIATKKGKSNAEASEPGADASGDTAEQRSRRRRRGRGRDGTNDAGSEGESDAVEIPAATKKPNQKGARAGGVEASVAEPPEVNVPEAEPVPGSIFRNRRVTPAVIVNPRIPIPANAPQVVVRDGIPSLTRAGRVYPPIFFFGSPADEKRATTVLEELNLAAEAGIHLHSFLVDFEVDAQSVDATVAFAAYMLGKSVEIDPECQILFRLVFQAPRGWQDRYPNARYRTQDGRTAEPSVCDDEFWSAARNCLKDFIQKMRMLPVADHILGVHLERGEWFLADGWGYDTSKAAQIQFRNWARTRYNNDEVTLRASWFDGAVKFDNLMIPEFQPEGTADEKFIRSSRRQRRYVDYHLFLSDATVARIGDLAYAAKAASEGMFLVGASYGYTFEWSHPASCHLGLGKLLRTEEVDFIAGPPSYRNREPGGSAPFPVPIDSFALNGKLYLSEEDFKTSLSTADEPDDFNPAIKTPQALESVHWRGAGVALAHGSGMAWMDLWGNGWLKTHSVWERAAKVSRALIDRMKAPLGDPDVAIFIDERSLAYLVDPNAFTLLVQNVRESVLRAGVSSGFYLLSDLAHREKFPESKLYIFLNAWDIRPELRAAIKNKLHRDNKVLLWLYAAGLFDAGRDSLERAREVTGIALKAQPFYSKSGTTLLNRRHPLSEAFPDKSLIGGTKLEPSYFAIPEGATVLGEYSQTGLPSFVVKEFKDDPENIWTSVFLGEPLVNPALIRSLSQLARAHVWNFSEDVVHVRAPFCTIHCGPAGPRSVTLPDKVSAYNLLTGQWAAVDTTNIRFTAVEGSTHVFLVGPKVEIEHLLQTDPADVLKMDEIPEREANIASDGAGFDVPIMRLDEWMESTDQDEVADDWFLRMPQVEDEPVAPAQESSEDRIGRHRRRRGRTGNDRERDGSRTRPVGSEEVVTQRYEPSGGTGPGFEELSMNVVFRKRE